MVEIERGKTEQQVISELLVLFNEGRDIRQVLDRAVALLMGHLRCEALGVRVMDKQGNIPYQTYAGFKQGFIAKESPLCIRHDKCACIEISRGEYDPAVPLYTPWGSFYTNELQSLEPVKAGMTTGRFRGECVRSGWESLALVPIRFGHKYFGLIHAVDGGKGSFPLQSVRFLENIAGQLGLYMHGLEAQAERESEFSSLIQRIMHDLKSPLFSTKMFAELMETELSGSLSAEAADYLRRISRNAEYMGQLVAGLSSFAQVCDPAPKDHDRIDLSEFIPKLVSDVVAPEHAGIKVDVSEGLPTISYPALSLKRLMTNLLGNAVKYSKGCPDPTVEVSCQEKDMFYQISVSDNGMGMDEADVGKVFQPFYRTEGAREIPGTGLGLSICKKIAERNGGRIWVYSDKGKGSTFYFTVPK